MGNVMLFREIYSFPIPLWVHVCGTADVPLTTCRRDADFPLTLPQTLNAQEALQAVKNKRGDVADLDPQNAPESHQKGLSPKSPPPNLME